MLNWTAFRNTVASVVCALDSVGQLDADYLRSIMQESGVATGECAGVLRSMVEGGLLANDRGIYGITPKGRALAADIRALTSKVVC